MINYVNEWKIGEAGFQETNLGKFEAIMAMGNGYLGIRNTHEEDYPLQKRDMFVSGVFNRFSNQEVTELANFPDISKILIWIDGIPVSLLSGDVYDYKREFDYFSGKSTRSFTWRFENEVKLKFNFEKFVSMSNHHLFTTRVQINNLGKSVSIRIQSGIDGTMTNTGSQHFEEGEKRYFDNRYLHVATKTTESNVDIAVACTNRLESPSSIRAMMERRQVYQIFEFDLLESQDTKFIKYSLVKTSRDLEYNGEAYLNRDLIEELNKVSKIPFEELMEESQSAWRKIWTDGKIEIEGPIKDQLLLNFARYHLHIMSPVHDDRLNIGAKGISGEGYKGHTFWDTEIFMLPYFTYTYPEWAKNLVMYRINGLVAAQENAVKNGYKGAQYPWESAWLSDGEVTPKFGDIDLITGKPTPILTGEIEHHVTGDVVYGVTEYLKNSTDPKLLTKVTSILSETAKFWVSRTVYNNDKQRYEINDVIGPDEYKEHVNNNAYTNYLAKYTLDKALEAHGNGDKIFSDTEFKQVKEVSAKLYLPQPNEQGVIPQDDTYLSKPTLDIQQYIESEKVNTIFLDYNLEQINELQVSKQADVILLMLLFPEKFNKKLFEANWDYYYPKTLHDSSLSLSTHCNFALLLEKIDVAYNLFQKSFEIDLGSSNMASSDMGIHAASMGGIWQNVVKGFGGFSVKNNEIVIKPQLPECWSKLIYTVTVKNSTLQITIKCDGIFVELLNGSVCNVAINGKIFTIDEKQIVKTINE